MDIEEDTRNSEYEGRLMIIYDRIHPFYRYTRHEGTYGIEIETEVLQEEMYPTDFLRMTVNRATGKKFYKLSTLHRWEGHVDNSLRNFGVEYVLKKPLSYENCLSALDDFSIKTSGVPFIQDAPSTSVHVHWNVLNETFLTMANFLALYSLYENLLIAYCGPLRRSNLFALPIRVSEKVIDTASAILSCLGSGEPVFNYKTNLTENSHKYGALNLASFASIGSLEIRSMRGTTDVNVIKQWLSIIDSMVKFARSSSVTPSTILELQRLDPLELFTTTFGVNTGVLRETAGDDFDFLIEKNLWYIKQIEESVPDWTKFNSCLDQAFEAYLKLTDKMSVKTKNLPHPSVLGQEISPFQTVTQVWGTNTVAPAMIPTEFDNEDNDESELDFSTDVE